MKKRMKYASLLLPALLYSLPVQSVQAQHIVRPDTLNRSDSLYSPVSSPLSDTLHRLPDTLRSLADTLPEAWLSSADSMRLVARMQPDAFKPIPKRAVIYSAIFPGLGQIYNRKYWKLPIVYGGFVGFVYAITWNNKMHSDYYTAYVDLHEDRKRPNSPELWHTSWQDHLSANQNASTELTNSYFEDRLRRGVNYYRRYRDLSIILTAAWYLLCMADAYVDAQLFDFDITPDLSMRITPMVTPDTKYTPELFGLNCSINF